PSLNLREELHHVGCGHAVRAAASEFVEDALQVVAPRDDDSDAHDPKLEKKAEIVEVAVKEGGPCCSIRFPEQYGSCSSPRCASGRRRCLCRSKSSCRSASPANPSRRTENRSPVTRPTYSLHPRRSQIF